MTGSIPRNGRYGIDAPYAPALMAFGLVACLGLAVFAHARQFWFSAAILALILGCYLHTTLRGKFVAWARVLDAARLRSDERALDLGCGRGAVLLLLAQRLPRGSAVGIDIWSGRDQSGNAMQATLANAATEGVTDRIELQTADMRALPFADASFDLVVSNLAIHNIAGTAERDRAIDEAWRVLRPGGRLLVADIRHARRYRDRLAGLGASDLSLRGLGWRMWWGGPWAPTRLVEAGKPMPG